MTNEKRFVLFVTIVFLWMMGANYLFPRRKPAPLPAAADKLKAKDKLPDLGQAKVEVRIADKEDKKDDKKAQTAQSKEATKNDAKAGVAGAPSKPEVELVKVTELVLGSVTDKSVGGYRIEAQLEQKGAGIYSVYSSRYNAEPEDNGLRGMGDKRPLRLIDRNKRSPPTSLALTLSQGNGTGVAERPPQISRERRRPKTRPSGRPQSEAGRVRWIRYSGTSSATRMELICPARNGIDPLTKRPIAGQAVVFTIKADNGVIVTQNNIRLFPNTDGLEVDLNFESPDKERSVVYNLLGPHGIPIEGDMVHPGPFATWSREREERERNQDQHPRGQRRRGGDRRFRR